MSWSAVAFAFGSSEFWYAFAWLMTVSALCFAVSTFLNASMTDSVGGSLSWILMSERDSPMS